VDLPRPVNGHSGPEQGYTIGVSVILPHSRGSVRLADATPGSAPLLDPNFLADERDLAAVTTGLRLAQRIGASDAFSAWRDAEAIPDLDAGDEAGIREYARRGVASYCHQTGTLAMGDGPAAVADPANLRVRGLNGVRVADSSIMPRIPSANTNATVYAIAERAAEMILRS
jgi:choline dehydrogenase